MSESFAESRSLIVRSFYVAIIIEYVLAGLVSYNVYTGHLQFELLNSFQTHFTSICITCFGICVILLWYIQLFQLGNKRVIQ